MPDERLLLLRRRLQPLRLFCGEYFSSLPSPKFVRLKSGENAWRYENPGIDVFCLLFTVRNVSALAACIRLLPGGFVQEVCVLIRTIVENCHLVEFVLEGGVDLNKRADVETYLNDFFLDSDRLPDELQYPLLKQGDIRRYVGGGLDAQVSSMGNAPSVQSESLLRKVQNSYSNYVHARYPELMELVGGYPCKVHPNGMSGTPKEDEIFDMVETFIETVSNTIRLIILHRNLEASIKSNPELDHWWSEFFGPSTSS